MKKTISKILAIGVMILAMSFSAMAQGPGGPGGFPGGQMPDAATMAKQQADQMKTLVKLTDEQYTKVLAVFKSSMEEMGKSMSNGFDFEAMQKANEQREAKIKAILTAEQYKKWSEEQSKRRGPGGPGGPGGFPGGGPAGPPPGM